MVNPIFQRRRNTLITLIILSCIFVCSLFYRYYIRPSNLTGPSYQDLDFLAKFCSQHSQYYNESLSPSTHSTVTKEYNSLYGFDAQMKQSDIRLREDVWDGVPVKGAFYMLVREEDLYTIRATIHSMEDRFNGHLSASYPWIFLSSQSLSPEFKQSVRRVATAPHQVYFGMIDLDTWTYPQWVNSDRAEEVMKIAIPMDIKGAHSLSKKQKMRYQTGLFQHHVLFKDVDYVWRIEPGTMFDCNMYLEQDPFLTMKQQNKKIGFSITNKEDPLSMISLFPAALTFMSQNPDLIQPKDQSIMPWLITGSHFNFCSFVTDSEIMDLSFLRSKEYLTFFHYLDLVGGFFYEYWLDGPVRTLAAAMFLTQEEVHFFDSIGYGHTMHHCPFNNRLLNQCSCDYLQNHNLDPRSCTVRLLKHINPEVVRDIRDFAKTKLREQANLI